MNELLPTWGFTLKQIIYQNITYNLNLPSIIDSSRELFFENNEVYNIMTVCNSQSKEQIEFIMDNLIFKLKLNLLPSIHKSFNSEDGRYGKNFTGVVFGAYFLKLFQYVLFDYDNKQIEFYSNEIIIINSTFLMIKLLLISIITLCLFSIIIILKQIIHVYKNLGSQSMYIVFKIKL